MADSTTGEREVCIGENGDYAHTVDTIYMWHNLYKRLVEGILFSTVVDPTRCRVKSQFSSMKAWYRTVNKGTCHALTPGGDGYIGNNLMFSVLRSSAGG
jgi:hypothetical protein